ncbi:MAG: hypothetical protein EOO40_12095, partial [Deltaproteobacteria bacterium]
MEHLFGSSSAATRWRGVRRHLARAGWCGLASLGPPLLYATQRYIGFVQAPLFLALLLTLLVTTGGGLWSGLLCAL